MVPQKTPPRRAVLVIARLVTVVVSLAGAEAMLWFAGYPSWWALGTNWGGAAAEYECDPDLGWKARAGQFDLVWPDRPHGAHYTNWNAGRRATAERESAQDTGGRPQVLFFGDSYVQGYGSPTRKLCPGSCSSGIPSCGSPTSAPETTAPIRLIWQCGKGSMERRRFTICSARFWKRATLLTRVG